MSQPFDDSSDSPQPTRNLADDLATMYRQPANVPAEVDRAILELAGRRISAGRRRWLLLRWAGVGAAAAAAVVVVALRLASVEDASPVAVSTTPAAIQGDLDGNGKVDIADAFRLAREIQRGQVPPGSDITRDGVTDQKDVDSIAMMAVALSKQEGTR